MEHIINRFLVMLLFNSIIMISKAQSFEPFTIQAKGKLGAERAYLMYYAFDDDEKVVDSTAVHNGVFSFTGKIEGPCYGGIIFGSNFETASHNWNAKENLWFTIFKGETQVSFEEEKPQVIGNNKGLESAAAFNDLRKQKTALFQSDEALQDRDKAKLKLGKLKSLDSNTYNLFLKDAKIILGRDFRTENTEVNRTLMELRTLDSLMVQKYGRMEDLDYRVLKEFIASHPHDEYSLYRFKSYLTGSKDYEEVSSLYSLLGTDLQSSNVGKKLAYLISTLKIKEGVEAIGFSQADINGQPVNLSDYRGKYVLIDFWASWCVPCRNENPTLVKAYDKFKDNDFEILGISLDNKKENWLKAITEDSLTWTHVSDLKGWKNEIAVLYGIRAVPSNFLIDPQGTIIAKNLRGEELLNFLEKIF